MYLFLWVFFVNFPFIGLFICLFVQNARVFPTGIIIRPLGDSLVYACVECGFSRLGPARLTFSHAIMVRPMVILGTVAVCVSGRSQCYVELLRRSAKYYMDFFMLLEKLHRGCRFVDDLGDLALSRWSMALVSGYDVAGSTNFIELWRLNALFLAVLKCMDRGRSLLQ